MSDNELLLAVSDMMDKKLKPIHEQMGKMETHMDNMETSMDKMETRMDNIETSMDKIETRMDNIETSMDKMETRMDNIETRMDNVEINIDNLETRMMSHMNNGFAKIYNILENEIRPDIKLLAENFLPAATRFEKSTMEIEDMQSDIELLKKVVVEHSEKLQKIS